MAAVYTADGGVLKTKGEGLTTENNLVGAKHDVESLMINTKKIKVEDTSGDPVQTEQVTSSRHAAAMDAVPVITIKEERIGDDEYFQIKLGDIGESSDDITENNDESDGDNESIDGDWLFRCVDCGEAFGQREAYLEHRREHTHDGPIVCLDSDSQWGDLLVSEDGGRRTLCCALCGRKFSSSRGFFAHQLKHRNQALKQEPSVDVGMPVAKQRLFECNDCGKTYSTVGLYLNHQRSHKQASKSVFHQLAHLKKKSFQCPTCGRSYSRASALDAHRRCHEVKLIKSRNTGIEKPPPLQELPEASGDVDAGADKKRRSLHECPECGKAFRTSSGLSTHQRFSSHPKCSDVKTKEDTKKSFHCPECEKTFLSNVALAAHQRWHIRRAQISSSSQSLSCEECGKVFSSLTFYHKHQRLVHSEETPAKSFLHQVCQLQKKAFGCQDCGRRFSRASALQSHQLCHTDDFGDAIEKVSMKQTTNPTSKTPPQKLYLCDKAKPESFAIGALVYSQDTPQSSEIKEDLGYKYVDNSAEVDMEDENRDLHVEVVSLAGSDSTVENTPLDSSTPLPVVCESEQEVKEETNAPLSQTKDLSCLLKSKAEVDVELNFETVVADNCKNQPFEVRNLECPECGRTFASASAIRCHRLWHRRPMGRAAGHKTWTHKIPGQTYLKKPTFKCTECGKESYTLTSHHTHLRQHEDPKPYKSLLYQLAGLQKNSFECEECGMRFSRASALQSHQQHHKKPDRTHECPLCDKSYSSHGALYNHRKACHGGGFHQETTGSNTKEGFNPRKTLLGPKVYHCEKCGKGFWSLGAFSQHKQYQQCVEVKDKKDSLETLVSLNGHTRAHSKRADCPICGKRFRHRGYLACHMKKHRSIPMKYHKCEICGKSYSMLACFLKHQQVHDSKAFPPPIKSFQYQVEQVKKNMYSCPDCGKRFSRAMALQFHMRSHGYETGYPFSAVNKLVPKAEIFNCPACPARFSSDATFQGHLSRKHAGIVGKFIEGSLDNKEKGEPGKLAQSFDKGDKALQQESENRCQQESGPKASLKSLPQPPAKSVDSGKYKCSECGRGFSVVGALNFHKRVHLKDPAQATASLRPTIPKLEETKCREDTNEIKGLYICPECGRSFGTNSALGTHRRWHTDKRFANTLLAADILRSSKKKFMDDGPFRCNQCGKGFFYFCVLRRHQMHHPESEKQAGPEGSPTSTHVPNSKPSTSTLSCPKCDKTFPRASLLAAHYQSHNAKTSVCSHCSLSFYTKEALQRHQSKVHSNAECCDKPDGPAPEKQKEITSKKLKLYGCPDCSKRFFKVRGLRAHRWQAHRKSQKTGGCFIQALKPFPCTGCEKRYSSQGALYNHRKICTVTKRELKPKTVLEEYVAPRHFSEQMNKCLFKCHKCGKAFPSPDQLEVHKDMARSRPHCCALCCRGYWTETQLQQHLVWHDEVRRRLPADLRYRLSTCNLPTGNISKSGDCTALNLRDTNPVPSKPLQTPPTVCQSPKRQKCPQSGEAFETAIALQQHQSVHSGHDPYHCSLCPRVFSQIQELIDHHQDCMIGNREQGDCGPVLTDITREGNGLTCIECGITFCQEVELHQHYIEHARGEY